MQSDLLFALRVLRKSPAFSLAAILTLGLGIGANTALFSVTYHVLRSLPYPASDRLVRIYSSDLRRPFTVDPSIPDFVDMRQEATSFEAMEAFRYTFVRSAADPERRLMLFQATPGLLDLIGARAVRGRLLQAEDMSPSSPPVAVLSFEYWVSEYGSSDSVINETLRLGKREYAIVGVATPVRNLLSGPFTAFVPWILENDRGANFRGNRGIRVLARLRSGVDLSRAQAELDVIGEALRQEYPKTNADWMPLAVSFYEETVKGVRPSLLALSGAAVAILLIAIANIANLLLARGSRRRPEIAIRAALGASRARLARLLLTESLLLSLIGGGAGLFFGWALVEVFVANTPVPIPRLEEVSVDGTAMSACLAVTLAAGLLFGLAPVLSLQRSSQTNPIRAAGARSGHERQWAQSGLVIAQLALSLVLLVGSGLLIRSFLTLRGVPLGIDYQQIVTFSSGGFSIGGSSDHSAKLERYRLLLEAVRSIPGVTDATLTSQAPLAGGWGSYGVEVLTGPDQGKRIDLDLIGVTADFFQFFGSPAVEGRLFDRRDRSAADSRVVVDANLAAQVWPDLPAVGQRLRLGKSDAEVIGVVKPIRYGDLAEKMRPKLYNLLDHSSGAFGGTFLIRHQGDAEPIMGGIRSRLGEMDSSLRFENLQPLSALYDRWLREPRFYLLLMSGLAALALAVAAVGVYGVLSYSISRRTSEIGIRLALGAGRKNILALVSRQTAQLLCMGLACGAIGAFWLTRYLHSLLFQVEPTDPWAMASMAIVLAATTAVATLLPIRRALGVDPARTLRAE